MAPLSCTGLFMAPPDLRANFGELGTNVLQSNVNNKSAQAQKYLVH